MEIGQRRGSSGDDTDNGKYAHKCTNTKKVDVRALLGRAIGDQFFWGVLYGSIIHEKKDFCGGDGYFGQKKLAENFA